MDQKDFLNIINSRRSIRNFTNEPVSKDLIIKIVEAASKAPSACNVQGWHFIVIDDEKIKQRLIDFGGSIVIKNAPLGIMVLYDNRTKDIEYHDYIQSAAAGIENLLLAATYYGLGSCWICHLPSKKQIRKILSIPPYYEPVAYVLIGYKQKEPIDVLRKHSVEDLISYNEFRANFSADQAESNLFIKRVLVKIYRLTPLFLKKKFLNKFLDKNFVKKFEN